jgi:Dolichyl-phosphate-mannose-protein mannosyltransferase
LPKTSPSQGARPRPIHIFSGVFVAVLLLHSPLLRLPFFWDEAGFYIPAVHDLIHLHSVIGKTTVDTGHPPLSAAYLAACFLVAGWKPIVARVAMLAVAAFALTNVFLLARRISNTGVAVASTIATAVYPVFFAQSSLAHADLMAAAFTLWGIRLGLERRLWTSQLAFSLAVLSKETAVVTPIAIGLWEFLALEKEEKISPAERLRRAALYLIPVLPLASWLLFHHHATGRFFGDAQFYQYNVGNVMVPVRFVIALGIRIWQLFGFMNMLVLTAAMIAALWFPAVVDQEGERQRISIPVQIQFYLIILLQLITFSIVGGALLPRYLLSAYPLVIIIGMSTVRRRTSRWEWPAALVVIAFALALFFNPPFKLAPEDNLTYKDFVELHVDAVDFLNRHERDKTILTAWPATDELTKPYLGYVKTPLTILPVENFTVEEVFKARAMRRNYQTAFVFSTKYNQPTWFGNRFDRIARRYFDYHTDLPPEAIANVLGAKIVFLERRKAEWVAVMEMEEPGVSAENRF